MLMRYHWGLGIGHTYSHASPTIRIDSDSAYQSPRQPPSNINTGYQSNHVTCEFDDLEHLDAELELGEVEFEPPSPVESDLDSDSDDLDSILDDCADLDGWEDLDRRALDGYEF